MPVDISTINGMAAEARRRMRQAIEEDVYNSFCDLADNYDGRTCAYHHHEICEAIMDAIRNGKIPNVEMNYEIAV